MLVDWPNVGVISSTGTFISSLSSSLNDAIDTPGDGSSSENGDRGDVLVVVLVTFCTGEDDAIVSLPRSKTIGFIS